MFLVQNAWVSHFLLTKFLELTLSCVSQATQYSPSLESPEDIKLVNKSWLSLVRWQLSCSNFAPAIVRTFLATNTSQRDLQPAKSSPFKVLLSLRKLVRFRYFLRTLLPRRISLVGADTSNETGRFQTQILVNRKKKFFVEGTRNLAFAGDTFLPSLVFSFSFLFHVPFLWRQTNPGEPPSLLPWSFSFLDLLTSPSCGDRLALADWAASLAFPYLPLYVACRQKNPSLSWFEQLVGQKKLNGESCTPLGGI